MKKYIFVGDLRTDTNIQLNKILTKLYGLNNMLIINISNQLGVYPNISLLYLNDSHYKKLNILLQKFKYNKKLKKLVHANRKYKIQIGLYQGLRFKMGLPCRGQRTKTNAKTTKRLRQSNKFLKQKNK